MGCLDSYNLWKSDEFFNLIIRNKLQNLTDEKEIKDRFERDLEIISGGAIGIMDAGTNRINQYTVGRIAAGLGNYLIGKYGEDARNRGVVVAFDTRNNSKYFARVTADVLSSLGIKVYLHSLVCPIPQLSYTIRLWKSVSGVMITALDSPKEYNGIIIYDEEGNNVSADVSNDIAACVKSIEDYRKINFAENSDLIHKGDVADDYISFVRKQSRLDDNELKRKLKIVYTPLHGTGNVIVTASFMLEGFTNLTHVNEQVKQDGDFSTLDGLKPDVKGLLEMAIAQGVREDADIVIATSPACDRCFVATRSGEDFVMLGDERIDALLSEYAADDIYKGDAIVRCILICELAAKVTK